ncbi:CHASE2 domain-containing protein [Microseira sp. BLCC-F43]|jgi:CHASE2 domain-containing sensor protein/CheY-like chemotaxis protein/nitrogen-specific signal transduction histidine kinase|uniref:CHASE2 domain-containing protein n=1 Tax=Microseira sp. BLCC-F43 TaxID=3153602 RepID=UPI0035BA2B0C
MWKKLTNPILPHRGIGITAIGVAGAVLALQGSGALQLLESTILDQWFRWRPLEKGSSSVIIVTIDEPDISRLGSWPMSDAKLAKVIQNLKQQQPRVIGLDIYRNLKVEPGHQELLNIFATTPNLIGIQKVIGDGNGPVVPPPPVLPQKNQVAASDLVLDADGKIRRHLLSILSEGKIYSTLGAKLALAYLEAENIYLERSQYGSFKLGKAKLTPLQENEGGYVDADSGGYQILANFHRLRQKTPTISVTDVLANKIPANLMRGRIVLIGSVAESTRDRFLTPYSTNSDTVWSGVQVHADLASQLVSAAIEGRQILRGIPEHLNWVWIFFWSSIGAALAWRIGSESWVVVALPVAGVSLVGSAYLLFLSGWWVTAAAPFLALVSAGVVSRVHLLWTKLKASHQALKESHQALEDYAQILEQKVRDRTAELLGKNTALEQARQDAEAANRAKSAFLANMSHELRTPLNAILGFSQLLSSQPLPPPQKEQLAIINRSGNHLLNLINEVLELAKIEAGKTDLNLTCADLEKLLKSLQEMFQIRANAKQLEMVLALGTDLPQYIQTDEGKLSQILINLLGNAFKFTSQGSVTLRVRVQGSRRDMENIDSNYSPNSEYIIFEIEDTGPGIAPSEINQLFGKFAQTSSGRKSQQGTGLGLAISYQLAKLMGGEIAVKSIVGKGSIFKVTLPLMLPTASAIPAPTSEQKIVCLAPNQPNYRILVVEDILENRLFLVQLLSAVGFEVGEAENGQEGISLWSNWHPDLILMDMRMPVMNGYEATKQIKATPKGKRITIIALTAGVFDDKQAILTCGCDDWVQKPFRTEELLDKIAQYLKVRYVYAQSETQEENNSNSDNILNPETLKALGSSLATMPIDWRTELQVAASSLDDQRCLELIGEIAVESADIYQNLTNLVENFRMDIIADLCQ